MTRLEDALARARALDVDALATSIERMGFDCTRCGECCRGDREDPHVATVQPEEARDLRDATGGAWRDVARPVPYGLDADGLGETFEWALETDACGDCTFLETDEDGTTACSVYADRPAICRTYPFQVDVAGTTAPSGEPVDRAGDVIAYECEGLGRDIDRATAESLARELKDRTIRDVQAAIDLLDGYTPRSEGERTIVIDAEGAKHPDGSPREDPGLEDRSDGRQN